MSIVGKILLVVGMMLGSGYVLTSAQSTAKPIEIKQSKAEDYWFCKGIGHVNDKPVIFLSVPNQDAFADNYDERQNQFSEHLKQKTENQFRPSFISKCRDYQTDKRALKHLELEIKTAKQYNFQVVIIDWRYDPNEGREETDGSR